MFDAVDPKQRLPDLEEGILQYWREEDTFKRSIRQRKHGEDDPLNKMESSGQKPKAKDQKSFSFYDGPPFATGLPHYGHLLAGTIKDVIPRYQTMRGNAVERRFGWDCHGLPIENIIEQENEIKSKREIEEMGVAKFNALCRGAVQRYTKEWRTVVERMGRWVDMDWDYRTMDADFMESIWWAFKSLSDKELIYEGLKPMHICPRCATPLSNFEVTQGYRDRTDLSVIMTFPLKDDPKTVILAWTTTPWSLPGNTWVAVGRHITYVRVQSGDTVYILAEKLVESVFKEREHEVLGTIAAKDLQGKRYEPLFPYYADTVIPRTAKTKKTETYGERVFKVVMYDDVEVSDTEGTGIVHITSSLGEDSYAIAVKENVDVIHHVRIDGYFADEVKDFRGVHVKPEGKDPMATDKLIVQYLKDHDRYFASFPITHSYPHCWRCDTPLLPYTTSSWFVAIDRIKEAMLASNAETEWVPAHIRDGRFGKWLQGARDWAISRNRYWGTPLPIWRTQQPSNQATQQPDYEVIGSRDDLLLKNLIRFTKITTIRHAESEGNLIPIYQCKIPGTDLTEKGKNQAKAAAEFLAKGHVPVDIIYTSPLARCQQTAAIIAKKTGAKVVIDERLREVEFGEYEGKNVDFSDLSFLKARRQHKIETGKPESIYHFPGMETWESVQERVKSFLDEKLPLHRSEHILIVSHADPVVNMKHYFTGEDAVKLSHQPYPDNAITQTYFYDHTRERQVDLHKDAIDDLAWPGAKSEGSVELTLVRHGETDWNVEDRLQGQEHDTSLNKTGKEQAAKLAAKLKKKKFDVILSSDLKRAVETGRAVADAVGAPLVQWEILRERSIGTWNGKTLDEVLKIHPSVAPGDHADSMHHVTPTGGESLNAFIGRAQEACERILKEYAGKRVLLVSHGGTTAALMIVIKNLSHKKAIDLSTKNTETYEVTLNPLMKRIPEVLDCWFESGSMPYAQDHYPFEMRHMKADTPKGFPADFIAEGLDQTRGWFYTLNVLGSALFGESPFRNCIVNGIVLAEDGKKMSKKLKNYPDPMEVVHRHGADAVRFTLMSSPAVRAEDLRFSEKLVEETVRGVLLPLWNTYSFFTTYGNAAKFTPTENRRHSTHPLDVWIRAEVQDLVNRMTKELEGYDLSATCAELHETIDALTNWYVRLSRRRFAGKGVLDELHPEASGDTEVEDREAALHTLYDVLLTLSQLLAPFCPFITESIYLNLVAEDHGSVHLTDWPEVRELTKPELGLIRKNRFLRSIVSLGLKIRSEKKIKIRQPLPHLTVVFPDTSLDQAAFGKDLDILRQELNVKEVEFVTDAGQIAEAFVQVDARKVGPRLGGRVQEIIKAGKAGDFTVEPDGRIRIMEEWLSPDEAAIMYRGREGHDVAADKGVVVSLDTTLTDELIAEGVARDIIRGVQRVRKESGLEFTDMIMLSVEGADEVMKRFGDMIAKETRAEIGKNAGSDHTIEAGDAEVTIRFEKR